MSKARSFVARLAGTALVAASFLIALEALWSQPASADIATAIVLRGRQLGRQIQAGLDSVLEAAAGEPAAANSLQPVRRAINGPLRANLENPRYFTDESGRAIYLTGSHTWANLQDSGGSDPPPAFDYSAYLDFLEANNHNFIRLWTWEQARWSLETSSDSYYFSPMPYQRTGPGNALDGKPKFDLTRFDPAYFDRLRERVAAAGSRGIYVSVMLFNGWSVESSKGGFGENNPWKGHPFNRDNNINGIDGDPGGDLSGEEVHTLQVPAVTALQEAYVRKVIDTLNDLDNVLYEISNESQAGSTDWQYHMIRFVNSYEAGKPRQHPVGMTAQWPDGSSQALFDSPSDWISPPGDLNDPPAADGTRVILSDSDHLCGVCGDRQWVWKSFTRGLNPVFMDGYDGAGFGVGAQGFDASSPNWTSVRRSLGYALTYANRMDLQAARPRADLSSSGYCLAGLTPGRAEYLVYLPAGGEVSVDLSGAGGPLAVEWLNPATGEAASAGQVDGGAPRSFQAPFRGDAVLYLFEY